MILSGHLDQLQPFVRHKISVFELIQLYRRFIVQRRMPPQEVEESVVDTSAEHVKELEDELLKLRIENAFLKELRRLRLEEEALLKKQRESSTASEENSN